jgi:hypothetical protein
MSNILTILISLAIYFLSHSFFILLDMANRSKDAILIKLTEGLQLLFPPFQSLNIKDLIWSYSDFSYKFFLFNSFYSIAYLAIILYLTILIFNKKKFEN